MMDELIERIIERLDPDELIDHLGLTTEDLTARLYEDILEMKDKFYFLIEDYDNED